MEDREFWPIEDERGYKAALERVSALMDMERSPAEDGELDILAASIESYEDIHYPMRRPDPVSAIEFRLEQLGKTTADLAAILGDPAAAARILDRSRPLTFEAICALRGHLEIPVKVLTAGYKARATAGRGETVPANDALDDRAGEIVATGT